MERSVPRGGKFSIRMAIVSFQLAVVGALTLSLLFLTPFLQPTRVAIPIALFLAAISYALCAWILEAFWEKFATEFEQQMARKERSKAVSSARWLSLTGHIQITNFVVLFGLTMISPSGKMIFLAPALGALLAMAVGIVALSKESFVKELRK